jgi:hypothetical protein
MLWKVLAFSVSAVAIFERAALEAALADDDTVRNAQQLGVGELDTGTRVAIIVEHLDTGSAELRIERIGGANTT